MRDLADISAAVTRLKKVLIQQKRDAEAVDSWIRPNSEYGFDVPRRASAEHKALANLARTPWLGLVVANVAQAMYVDSIVTEKGHDSELWKLWLDNDMGRLQIANHRAFIAYGQSFGVVTPAHFNGVDTAKIRCLSPKRMACEWVDGATDVYPAFALEACSSATDNTAYRLYDEENIYYVDMSAGEDMPEIVDIDSHGVGVTPVCRFSNILDLDGNTVGEVTPFIPTAARINKTSYDRLLAQHFNSWKVRTIAGIDMPEDEDPKVAQEKADATKTKLSHEDLLISENPDTKFGVLDATSLDTFVAAWRADIEALAAVSQTPAHALTGQLVNLSAEALAAARAPLTQKVWERQVGAAATYSRLLRLAASITGLEEQAADPMVRITWQDMEIRSMSQAVDALGKAVSMLKIPERALWNKIPGVERSDVQEWERIADERAAADPINVALRGHDATTADSAGSTLSIVDSETD